MKTKKENAIEWMWAGGAWATIAAIVIALLFTTGFGWTKFKLWKAEYNGKALEIQRRYEGLGVLAEAENSKKARLAQAEAEEQAAEKIAHAIRIVGKAAQEFPEYRQQEFYNSLGNALQEGKIDQIIYLPTEAGMPLTEAGRLK